MAKKKYALSGAAKKVAKKKSTKKKVGKKKAPKKKRPAKNTHSSGKRSRESSVDAVLKKYENERSSQETQLVTLRKKIEDLETKTRTYQAQIAELKKQESVTENTIADLASRRDAEVSNLLSKLGVQLAANNPVPADENPLTSEEVKPEKHEVVESHERGQDGLSELDASSDTGNEDGSDTVNETL